MVKKYKVLISRMYIHSKEIEIEAKNSKEAGRKASEEIGDHVLEMKDYDPDQDYVEVLREIKE